MIMVMVVQLKRTMQPKRITNKHQQRLHTELLNPMMPHKQQQRSLLLFTFYFLFVIEICVHLKRFQQKNFESNLQNKIIFCSISDWFSYPFVC